MRGQLLQSLHGDAKTIEIKNVVMDCPVDANVVIIAQLELGNVSLNQAETRVLQQRICHRRRMQLYSGDSFRFAFVQYELTGYAVITANVEQSRCRINIRCNSPDATQAACRVTCVVCRIRRRFLADQCCSSWLGDRAQSKSASTVISEG